MEKYGVNELRKMFLEFFESKGHLAMKSFSLIPHNDKSLFLINSGMAPLKPYFTGAEIPPRRRVTTCQKCIRTGDIENVGKTARHGTFFEMLGNFSFGDYFKHEAIAWSWEFLTQVVGLDPNRLYPSIYQDDDEAFDIWNKKQLRTVNDMRYAFNHIDFKTLGVNFDEIKAIEFGNGTKEVVIFADPNCMWCHRLVEETLNDQALTKEYKFKVVAVPALGNDSFIKTKKLYCAKETKPEVLLDAMMHDKTLSLEQVPNCNTSGLDKRLVISEDPTLGMVPGLILAPGWSHTPTVAAALQAKTENINGNFNCSCLLDISADSDGAVVYTSVKGAKEALGASSAHAAALWPMVAVGEKKYYFSAMFAALTAYTDANNADVPYESPSNKDLRITATVLKDGTTVALDQQQANDVLNANGVITAINANGFKSWGNNTAAYPSTTDPKDRWWAVRRFFDWDGNNFIQTYFQKVDKPGNKRLIQSIVDSQNIIGNGYVARDYCAGYRVEFRSDENPVTNLLAGHLTVHTYLAPYIPAEYIENIREYDVDALESAIGGE